MQKDCPLRKIINRLHQPLNDSGQRSSDSPLQIIFHVPFKDQKSADQVRRRFSDLGRKIDYELQPVFTSKKIIDDLRLMELKPPLINSQNVVYEFQCNLCGAKCSIHMSSPSLTGNEGHMPFIYFEIPAKILLKDLDSLVLNFAFYIKIY